MLKGDHSVFEGPVIGGPNSFPPLYQTYEFAMEQSFNAVPLPTTRARGLMSFTD